MISREIHLVIDNGRVVFDSEDAQQARIALDKLGRGLLAVVVDANLSQFMSSTSVAPNLRRGKIRRR